MTTTTAPTRRRVDRSALLDRLTAGIARLADSEEWRRHLDAQARFHAYSANNVVLITAQCPEASRVAGFATWKKLGRSVRRGEQALWILAPLLKRDGEERRIAGFRYVPVFDIGQTEGEELPRVCRTLAGEDPDGLLARLRVVAEGLDFAVVAAELPGTVHGDCSFTQRRIRIEERDPPAQQVKTLVHELAHALLHEEVPDRARAELEAESVAYVVCQQLGVDTAAYSFGYVTVWAGGGEAAIEGIRTSCARIQGAAARILAGWAD